MLLNTPKLDESDLFLMRPEHISFVKTGTGKLYPVPRWLVIVLFGFLLLGPIASIVQLYKILNERRAIAELGESGIITQAQIVGHRTEEGKYTNYFLTFRYTTSSDRSYTKEESVVARLYNAKRDGDSIDVRYLPQDPETVRIATDQAPNSLYDFLLLLPILMAFYLMVFLARHSRKKKRLERDGHVMPGALIECKGREVNKKYQVTVKYRFVTDIGEEKIRTIQHQRDDLRDKPLPEPGTPVAILYADEKTYQML